MSSEARSRSSTSKQRGAAMSSRLMPPKPGAIACTVATISSVSFVARQSGHASMPPNSLKSSAFPSITGMAASGPMSPSPSTALPSVTTATVLRLIVRFQALSGSAAIARQTRATPGVYAIERSSRVFTGAFELMWILPPRWSRNVRSETRSTSTPATLPHAATIRSACSASVAKTLMSRIFVAASDADQVDRVEEPAGVRDRAGEVGEAARTVVEPGPQREAVRRGVVGAHPSTLREQQGKNLCKVLFGGLRPRCPAPGRRRIRRAQPPVNGQQKLDLGAHATGRLASYKR